MGISLLNVMLPQRVAPSSFIALPVTPLAQSAHSTRVSELHLQPLLS